MSVYLKVSIKKLFLTYRNNFHVYNLLPKKFMGFPSIIFIQMDSKNMISWESKKKTSVPSVCKSFVFRICVIWALPTSYFNVWYFFFSLIPNQLCVLTNWSMLNSMYGVWLHVLKVLYIQWVDFWQDWQVCSCSI